MWPCASSRMISRVRQPDDAQGDLQRKDATRPHDGFDPPSQNLNLPRPERPFCIVRRHPRFQVRRRDPANQFAGLRLARDDNRPSIPFRKQTCAPVQTQVGLPIGLACTVALEARVRQDRSNIPLEFHVLRRGSHTNKQMSTDPADVKVTVQHDLPIALRWRLVTRTRESIVS